MNIKDYFIALGFAAGTGLAIMVLVLLFSLISWALVWTIFAFALVPVFMKAIQFYRDTNCMDLEDFFMELSDLIKGENKKENQKTSDIDW